MPYYVWIAIGSAFGGMLRYWLGSEVTRLYGSAFPYATLAINVLGSFAIGFATGWSENAFLRFFVMVGLCGGFTTFSSFSLETLSLLRQGAWQKAAAYSLLSLSLCVLATLAGVLGSRR